MEVDLGAVTGSVYSLLGLVAGRATPRQRRLYAVACCRVDWGRLTHEASRAAVEAAERFADGLATVSDLDAARGPAYQVRADRGVAKPAADAAQRDSSNAAALVAHGIEFDTRFDRRAHLGVLLDVFGNTPFREKPVPHPTIRSSFLPTSSRRECDIRGDDFFGVRFAQEWGTTDVLGLAGSMYTSRDFFAMPVLADALEEAGCDHPKILTHCRSPSPHYRGCWVVDGLLGLASQPPRLTAGRDG